MTEPGAAQQAQTGPGDGDSVGPVLVFTWRM